VADSLMVKQLPIFWRNKMSLEKGIISKKEHRSPYRKSERWDRTCRPHGSCPWCEGRRLNKKRFIDKMAKKEVLENKQTPISEILER